VKSLDTHCVEFLRTSAVLRRNVRLVVAASGGLDSSVLAHIMSRLAQSWSFELYLVYVHHGLRTEADAEAEFVREMASDFGAEFAERRIDVSGNLQPHGASLQDVARTLRYAALEHVRVEVGAEAVLTAHHADDQAETLLSHFFRGSGVRGLVGIRPVRGNVLRPLLEVSRVDIEAWARTHALRWVEDVSNTSDAYTRNAIRHHVLPSIRRYVAPGIDQTLANTSAVFAALDRYLTQHAETLLHETTKKLGDTWSLALPALKGYFEFERMLLAHTIIGRLRDEEASIDEVRTLLALLDAAPGRRADLRHGVRAERERDRIVLYPPSNPPQPVTVTVGETVAFRHQRFTSEELASVPVDFDDTPQRECIDLDKAGRIWCLRPWRIDDVFQPLGSEGVQLVWKFLSARAYTRMRRERIPVLEGRRGIVWICGVRLDQRVALDQNTRHVARIGISDNDES